MHTNAHAPSRLLAAPSALWRGYRRHQERRAAADALRRLDDHLLRDIGIRRGDIDPSVRGDIW